MDEREKLKEVLRRNTPVLPSVAFGHISAPTCPRTKYDLSIYMYISQFHLSGCFSLEMNYKSQKIEKKIKLHIIFFLENDADPSNDEGNQDEASEPRQTIMKLRAITC